MRLSYPCNPYLSHREPVDCQNMNPRPRPRALPHTYVCNTISIRQDCRRPSGDAQSRKLAGNQFRVFDMNMRVDEARTDKHASGINFFNIGIVWVSRPWEVIPRCDCCDMPAVDDHIPFQELPCVHRYNCSTPDNQGRWSTTSSNMSQLKQLLRGNGEVRPSGI